MSRSAISSVSTFRSRARSRATFPRLWPWRNSHSSTGSLITLSHTPVLGAPTASTAPYRGRWNPFADLETTIRRCSGCVVVAPLARRDVIAIIDAIIDATIDATIDAMGTRRPVASVVLLSHHEA